MSVYRDGVTYAVRCSLRGYHIRWILTGSDIGDSFIEGAVLTQGGDEDISIFLQVGAHFASLSKVDVQIQIAVIELSSFKEPEDL